MLPRKIPHKNSTKLNDLAVELKEEGVDVSISCKHPKISEFAKLCASAAGFYYSNKLYIKCAVEREDLVQKACIKALENFNKFDPDRGNCMTWLYQVCLQTKSHHHSYLNAQKRKPEGYVASLDQPIRNRRATKTLLYQLEDEDSRPILDQVIAKETAALLDQVKGFMTPKQQEILELTLEGMSNADIARQTEVSRTRVSQQQKEIAKLIKEYFPETQILPDR